MTTSPEPCKSCGGPVVDGRCKRCAERAVSQIVRRDIGRIVLLSTIAIIFFLGTRAIAKLSSDNERREAAASYESGIKELNAGKAGAAEDDLRQATIHDRNNPQYVLALAEALAQSGHEDEALQSLMRIREDNPEDPEINHWIGKLEAKRGDLREAELYYHHALYGVWSGMNPDTRRRAVRMELIRFLIQQNQRGVALSELLALQSQSPREEGEQLSIANLALELGEAARAKSVYEQILHDDKNNIPALSGLARADHHLGQFESSLRTIQTVASRSQTLPPDLLALRETLQWISENDPTSHGLSPEQRFARLRADVDAVLQGLRACGASKLRDETQRAKLNSLETQLTDMETKLDAQKVSHRDDITDGFGLMVQAADVSQKACATSSIREPLIVLARAKGNTER